MHTFRFWNVLLGTVLLFSVAYGQLVYDPLTNTYKNTATTTPPVSTSTNTPVSSLPSQRVTSGSTTTGTLITGSLTTGTLTTGTITTGTITTGTTITKTTTSIISKYVTSDPASYKGVLSAMHIQLDTHTTTVMNKLATHLNNLDVSKSASLQQAADRLRTLTCLNIIPPTTNIYDVLNTAAISLQKSLEIVHADMHSDISALEEKIDKGLLGNLIQKIEIASMQNKIDSFLKEYTNVVDLFFEVSIGEVETIENLFVNLSPQAKKDLDAYTKTSAAYESVMKAYEEFLNKSSFANIIAGPHLHELIELTNGLKVYWRSVLLAERQTKVASHAPGGTVGLVTEQKKLLTQDFSLLFNEATQKVLGNLYPIDELLLLNQQIMGLRSAYTDESSAFANCRAFVENPTVKITGLELEKYMQTLLTELNNAVNKVATGSVAPKTKEELLSGLKKEINSQGKEFVSSLVLSHKTKLSEKLKNLGRELMSVPTNPSSGGVENAVRIFLQKKYLTALENKSLDTFQEQLTTISNKIDKKLSNGTLSQSQTKSLITIEAIVSEFLS